MSDPRTIDLLENDDFLDDLRGRKSQGALALEWGISSSTVHKWRTRLLAEDEAETVIETAANKPIHETFDKDKEGNLAYEYVFDRIVPLSWWIERLREDGYDPDNFVYSFGNSVWTQHTKAQVTKTLYANRFRASLKTTKERQEDQSADILERVKEVIEGWEPEWVQEADFFDGSLILCAADWQLGKVDLNGGTPETTAMILASFDTAALRADREKPAEIVIVDAGDIIENIFNVSSQRSTNDLGLPAQVEAAVRLMLEGIKRLAPLTPSLRYVAVPSNHGRSRVGFKAEAGDAHDDYGIAVARIVKNALTLNDAFAHVTVEIPEPHMESMAILTSGTRLGVVHGHQAGATARLETWWAGQALGRGPVAEADILIVGHWHHFNIFTTGDDRHIFVCPSADPGSAWLTNLKGHRAGAGMLSFLTRDGKYSDLVIL